MTLLQKQTFYQELDQFLRSGIPLPQAVDALIPETGGAVRSILKRLLEHFRKGQSVPDAFAALRPDISDLEASLIAAASVTGRLEQAFVYLAGYFAALESIRSGIVRASMWPLIQLHLGVLLINYIQVLTGGLTPPQYVQRCLLTLGSVYLGIFVLWAGAVTCSRLGRVSVPVDRALGWIPFIGKIRRHLALSRFCATYLMQLEAAINAMDSLRASGHASQSARVRTAVERAVPQVRGGTAVGAALSGEGVFPAALRRALRLGEETGNLDEELRRWADYYQKSAVRALETLTLWLPRLVYGLIALYLGYGIIRAWTQLLGGLGLNE